MKNIDKYKIIRLDLINKRNQKIVGYLYKPLKVGKMPLVIYAHELANTHEKGEPYAKFLANKGIATYIFDFPGGSDKSASDGLTTEMSVITEKDDLNDVIKILKRKHFVDKNNIFILGASQGGHVAALSAAENAKSINSLILMYPGFVSYFMSHQNYKTIEEIPDKFNFRGWIEVGKRFVTDIWNQNPYDVIGKYPGNVLILHGDEDRIVPIEYSLRAVDAYANAKLIIIKGARHIFFNENIDIACKHIIKFIINNLK